MAKRSLVLSVTAAILTAGVAVLLIAHFCEPTYQGKPLRVWLDEARRNGDLNVFVPSDVQSDASTARGVRAIGTAGIPTLIGMVRARDNAISKGLRELQRSYTWVPADRSGAVALHDEAVYGFAALGPAARSAVPDLATLLHDDDAGVRVTAARCIGLMGDGSADAVHDLENYLDSVLKTKRKAFPFSEDWDEEAYSALYALGTIGPPARSAVAQIMNLTNSASPVEVFARAALIKITGSDLNAALEPLKDTSNLTNWLVAHALACWLGSNATPAVPWLLGNLQQTNQIVQEHAMDALARIRVHPEQCIPAIIPFLRSTNGWIRFHSLATILSFGRSARPWTPIPEITRCLTDSDASVRVTATNALRRVDPEAAAKAGIK